MYALRNKSLYILTIESLRLKPSLANRVVTRLKSTQSRTATFLQDISMVRNLKISLQSRIPIKGL